MDELIGNLKTYEMKINKDSERREPKKEKNLVLKAESSDSSEENSDMAYLTKRFQKMVRRNGGIPKRGSSIKARNNDLYHRCGKPGHFIKDYPLGDPSSESERESDAEKSSMMEVETEATKLDNDKEILTIELGEAEQSRDDLVVCVVDLNETIANLEKEKEVLNEKITSAENERHVIITDLEETIEGLKREHRIVSVWKGKKVASETHIKLEKELTDVKTSLCGELEKNRQLQAELEKVKIDLEKSLKWTRSSDAVTAMYFNNSENRRGIGFQREKTPYNPHSKYVIIPDNWMCTHCRKMGTLKKIARPGFNLFRKTKCLLIK
ncbi:uncharacterized protein [Nicotiana sylvestris]|uniref:uncharacterized protein n=1 Tax=Nicotiana sylvestris TaxID=4096 RepID=UPI00388CE930